MLTKTKKSSLSEMLLMINLQASFLTQWWPKWLHTTQDERIHSRGFQRGLEILEPPRKILFSLTRLSNDSTTSEKRHAWELLTTSPSTFIWPASKIFPITDTKRPQISEKLQNASTTSLLPISSSKKEEAGKWNHPLNLEVDFTTQLAPKTSSWDELA